MTGSRSDASGIRRTSSRWMATSGSASSAAVTPAANRSRSTASAPPAGTRVSSPTRITSDPSRRISSLSSPTAFSSESPRNELLQTSSASRSVRCAAVERTGRISWRETGTPREAACHAASLPARPPPTIRTI